MNILDLLGLGADFMSFEERLALAEKGDEAALEYVARAYLVGQEYDEECDCDYEKAAYWALKFAETGNSIGQYNMGIYYMKGCGVERDFRKAAEWYNKAADNGDPDSSELAQVCLEYAETMDKAIAGDAHAQADIAKNIYIMKDSLNEFGSEKDCEDAIYWAERAIENGDNSAVIILMWAKNHNFNLSLPFEKVVEACRDMAENGDPESLRLLGCELLSGDSNEQKEGFKLIEKSAELGDDLAYRSLGVCYERGIGVKRNTKKAVEYYREYCLYHDDMEIWDKINSMSR